MVRLNYTIDPEYDWAMLQEMAKRRDFDIDNKQRLLGAYRKASGVLKKTKLMYQESWNEIGDYFFKRIEQITKHPWKYKRYYCVVSLVHYGLSNWGGNKIVRSWAENPYSQRKITAHELVITHLWDYLSEHGYKNLPHIKKWAFCEISAWAITGLDKKLIKRAWPWIMEDQKWPLKHNYPQLIGTQKKARSLYEKQVSFKKYTEKLVDILIRDHNIKDI